MPRYRNFEDIVDQLKGVQRQVETLSKANPLNNGTIDKGGLTVKAGGDISIDGGDIWVYDGSITTEAIDTGSLVQLYQGQLYFRAGGADDWGRITVDVGSSKTVRWYAPYDINEPSQGNRTTFTMQGYRSASDSGAVWIYSGGNINLFPEKDILGNADRDVSFTANRDASLGANGKTSISTGNEQLELWGLPTTSDGGNLALRVVDGKPRVYYGTTSSVRYKQDIAPHVVDTEALLGIGISTWRDINDVEERGDDAEWFVGVTAEDLHAAGLTEFVGYDEEGRPNSVKYDRLGSVGVLAVVKQLSQRVSQLEQSVE